MVATVSPYTDNRHRAAAGGGYDGVVRISTGDYYGTGTLLFDGRALLTAAHLLQTATGATLGSATVHFETSAGTQSYTATQVAILPGYDRVNDNGDLALVWLSSSAPLAAERYSLYRDSDEIGKSLTLVGYGVPGTGDGGTLDNYAGAPLRQLAQNRADADAGTLKTRLGSEMAWTPQTGTQMVADFDNGRSDRDALGRLLGLLDLGKGADEGIITPGDSGGPAFIDGRVAGVASYGASLSLGAILPDVDGGTNSSFGETGFWQRVSHYQQWIDQSLRAHYPDAPQSAAQVRKSVAEGHAGTTYAYFLVEFSGVRSSSQALLSVDYATRDGTATAGRDYLATHGTLVLYPDENQAAIAVEIVGDTTPEPDETFYLDVANPVGGSFGAGIATLTAVRTIVNDDGGLA